MISYQSLLLSTIVLNDVKRDMEPNTIWHKTLIELDIKH